MLTPVDPAQTCAAGWLAAAQRLIDVGGEAYNLVVDIDDPVRHTERDNIVITGLDRFLRDRRTNPVATVANTIFPQDLYRRLGAEGFRSEYLRAYDGIRGNSWGRYFERMVRWRVDSEQTTDQLQDLVDRLSKQLNSKQTFRHVYEMTLYDPTRDAKRNRNRQCLSFLSFKLDPKRGLMLTALYRNHSYISRALGNFIGLGQLMAYIAEQAGTAVGPLTCVSTHAEIDTSSEQQDKNGHGDACLGWRIAEARELIARLSKSQPKEPAIGQAATTAPG